MRTKSFLILLILLLISYFTLAGKSGSKIRGGGHHVHHPPPPPSPPPPPPGPGPNDFEPDEVFYENFTEKTQQSDSKILDTSPKVSVHIDNQTKQIKVGKCEVKVIDPDDETPEGQTYDYCDFLYGGQGKIFDIFVDFENNSIQQLKLAQVVAKDHIIIKLNGNLIFSSTGQDHLTLTQDKFYDLITDEPLSYYLGILVNGRPEPVQSQRVLKANPNIDVTDHLNPGLNKLELQLAVGYKGGYQINFDIIEAQKDARYHCENLEHDCHQGKERRLIDDVYHEKDCWQYKSVKRCNYPSKNDCHLYEKCHFVRDKECLLHDEYGNCVNVLKEFACQTEDEVYRIKRPKFEGIADDSTIPGSVKCHGLPCFDGVCGQTSFDKDTDMMSSLSHLSILNAARGKDLNSVSLFPGMSLKCINKVTSYSNCCKVRAVGCNKGSGWGHKIGAKCSPDEQYLADLRYQNLCEYVGETDGYLGGIRTLKRKHFCCWRSMLDKIIQVEGRKQLGMKFGSPKNPDCDGLSLEQLRQIDFSKIDFSPFYPTLINKMKLRESLNHFRTNPERDPNSFDINTGIGNNIIPNEADENYYK